MSQPNYNGKQPNNTAFIKNFIYGIPANLWKVTYYTKLNNTNESVIMPTSTNCKSLYIPGDLFVDGNIVNLYDENLKKNINLLNIEITDKLLNLKPTSFEFRDDPLNETHYGFIEIENEYPELVKNKPHDKCKSIKSVNYLEIVPLLVHKIQQMQKEIDELKTKVNS